MKPCFFLLRAFGVVLVLLLAGGCASTQQTENLLSAAGFKMVPATTPQQQSHLKTLPPGTVTRVLRDGKQLFVYPDTAQQVLFVGQDAQYQEYQRLRQQNQVASEQVEAAQLNSQPGWDAWGPEVGGAFVPVMPIMRR
jgi:hypothetical protein